MRLAIFLFCRKKLTLISSALANILSPLFRGRLQSISIALADNGKTLELKPFSAFILTLRCPKSIDVHFSSAISPHRAPVSFSNWQNIEVFWPFYVLFQLFLHAFPD
jgi:hypothetical protein